MLNVKKATKFVSHDIWHKNDHEYKSGKVRWAVKQFKVILFMSQGFGEHSIMVRSAALTFYTLLAIMPVAALLFGVAKGFGLEQYINDYLCDQFPQYSSIIEEFIEFTHSVLQRTKGGIIAFVGLIVLLWTAMKVFGNIESSFNSIWEVKKSRSIALKLSAYITLIFITPILWAVSNSLMLFIRSNMTFLEGSVVGDWLFWLLSVVAVWVMFIMIYKVMPNTKVKMASAVSAGLIAGTAFQLFQFVYIYMQSSVTQYNPIYGSFSAVPLFLIWLQTSWQILLIGAELSFAYQNVGKYEYEKMVSEISYDYRKKITIAVMYVISKHLVDGEGATGTDVISKELSIPVRMVREVLFDLEKCGLIVAIYSDVDKTNTYIPAVDVTGLTILDVVSKTENHGRHILNIAQSEEFNKIESISDKIQAMAESSPENILLIDIKI